MRSAKPKISLVIPNYNSGEVVGRCLASVFSQDYEPVELILADGGSTDRSIEICRVHRGKFTVFNSERDGGIAEALNKAFERASGDIFCWLAADDELAPSALRRVADIFAANPDIDVVTGGCLRLFPDGSTVVTKPPIDLTDRIRFQNVIEQPSTFWRAVLHRRVGRIDEGLKLAFDWDLWCRFNVIGARFEIVPSILSHYHFSDGNLTSRGGEKTMNEMFEVVRRHGPGRGATAHLYRFLFRHFDLHGVYDRPRTCSKLRALLFGAVLPALYLLFGVKVVHGYNWNFASRQMRGLKWYV